MIILDVKDKRPLYEQIIEKFSELILRGVLLPGEKIPSVRNLAMELSINPNTIQRAYSELEQRGFIYSEKGRGNFVSVDNNFLQKKQDEIRCGIENILSEAQKHEIKKEEVMKMIESVYGGGNKDA